MAGLILNTAIVSALTVLICNGCASQNCLPSSLLNDRLQENLYGLHGDSNCTRIIRLFQVTTGSEQLLLQMTVNNEMHANIAGPGAGFKFPPKKLSWLKRDALLFNVSIGCSITEPHFLYEHHDKFAVFPTYPLALVWKLDNQDVIDFYSTQASVDIPGVPKLDPSRLVDGRRTIQMLRPLPVSSTGKQFELQSTILGVYDKGKAGTVVKSEDVIVDSMSGVIYARIIGSLFYVGQGNWGGPRGPKEVSTSPPARRPDNSLTFHVATTSSHLYRLNGDYNPLHAVPDPGRNMGFGGIIMHGVYAYNCIAHALLKQIGHSDPTNLKEFEAKFTGVVRPSDTIKIDLWRTHMDSDGLEVIAWTATVVETQEVCLSNGKAVIDISNPSKASHL